MEREIIILGSTGSIGTQTLEVARNLGCRVCALSTNTNIDLLEQQAREFQPYAVAVADIDKGKELKQRLSDTKVKVYLGREGLSELVTRSYGDIVVTSVVGAAGLVPTLDAIGCGKDIALANKETLVAAGKIVMEEAKAHKVNIIPVDSEHSAIFQCLMGNTNGSGIKRILLTASGGPFRGKDREQLRKVTKEDALKHPNWKMGNKITVDSATLMNKGLEVIEARWLFGIGLDDIEVLIHPQSVIHSAVEFVDGSIIAQMGAPDMRIPIQFALTYPDREPNPFARLDLLKVRDLTFEEPDYENFRCLKLAYNALEKGGTMPAVMNAANEVAVAEFLQDRIGFLDIPDFIEEVMNEHTVNPSPTVKEILESDLWAREQAEIHIARDRLKSAVK